MIIRGGIPKPINGVAPAQPGGPTVDTALLQAHQFTVDCKTVWVRIVNLGAVPLRVFPQRPPETVANWPGKSYDLAVGETLEGWYEFTDIWLAGVGGTCAFKALLGLRVL